LTYSFAKTSGILEGAEEIMKPKEVVGPGGRLVRPTQEVEVRWTVLSGEDVDKTQNTRFYILDSAEVRKNMVLGKSYADFDGIFGNHETSVYKWKLPHKSRSKLPISSLVPLELTVFPRTESRRSNAFRRASGRSTSRGAGRTRRGARGTTTTLCNDLAVCCECAQCSFWIAADAAGWR
jgi:hypothetical protein